MELTKSDCHHLLQMERWCSYDKKIPLSMLEVIHNDLRNGGRNFSRFVNEETAIVESFTVDEIPEADVLLLWSKTPRALEYAVEVAVKYRDKYGVYPEFVTVTNPHPYIIKSKVNAEWFEQGMIDLGFPKSWVLKHHSDYCVLAEGEAIIEISRIVRSISCKGKPRVLVVAGAGFSLKDAQ